MRPPAMLTSRSSECERAIKRATSLAWQMATCEDDGHTLGTVVRHSRVSLGRVAARALCKGANFSSAAEASIRTADDGDSKRLPKASSKLMSGSSPLTEVPWYLSSIRQGVSSQLSAMGQAPTPVGPVPLFNASGTRLWSPPLRPRQPALPSVDISQPV